jgi:predicted ferric reductase
MWLSALVVIAAIAGLVIKGLEFQNDSVMFDLIWYLVTYSMVILFTLIIMFQTQNSHSTVVWLTLIMQLVIIMGICYHVYKTSLNTTTSNPDITIPENPNTSTYENTGTSTYEKPNPAESRMQRGLGLNDNKKQNDILMLTNITLLASILLLSSGFLVCPKH